MKKIKMRALDAQLVPIVDVYSNDYNPNVVSSPEMGLLKLSIEQNGFCFPIVVVQDDAGKYCIVDGFHRYVVMRDMLKQSQVPVVILDQTMEERVTATVQFNRARGVHQIIDMTKLVAKLLKLGMSDGEIIKKLGMDADELLRLKQMTGLKEAFKDREFSKSWEEFESKYANKEED